jgi:hypothetical protein
MASADASTSSRINSWSDAVTSNGSVSGSPEATFLTVGITAGEAWEAALYPLTFHMLAPAPGGSATPACALPTSGPCPLQLATSTVVSIPAAHRGHMETYFPAFS